MGEKYDNPTLFAHVSQTQVELCENNYLLTLQL